jgi:hypothetical protein
MANMDEKIPVFGAGMRNTGAGAKGSKSKLMGKRGDSGGKGRPIGGGGITPIKNPGAGIPINNPPKPKKP